MEVKTVYKGNKTTFILGLLAFGNKSYLQDIKNGIKTQKQLSYLLHDKKIKIKGE